jgi:hypothetical protein
LKKHVIDERYKRINNAEIDNIGDINNNRQYPISATPERLPRRHTMVTVTTAPIIHDNELYNMTQEQIEETLREEEMLDDIERMMKEEDIHHERAGNPVHNISSTSPHTPYYDNIQDNSFIPIQENHTDYYQPTVYTDDTYYSRKRRRIITPIATTYTSMDHYIQVNFNQPEVNNLNYDFQMEVDDPDDDQMEVDDPDDDQMEVDDPDDDQMEIEDNGSIS